MSADEPGEPLSSSECAELIAEVERELELARGDSTEAHCEMLEIFLESLKANCVRRLEPNQYSY